MSGWVLRCLLCREQFTGDGPMPHTTQAFICDECAERANIDPATGKPYKQGMGGKFG